MKGTALEKWRKEKVMNVRRCHACVREGHIASHCFKKAEDKQTRAREARKVRCAHRDTVLYPLAEVEIELDGEPM